MEMPILFPHPDAVERFNAGVGNLFCNADRFKTEFFSGTGLQKLQMFSNEYLLQLV